MEIIKKYFPEFTIQQLQQLEQLHFLYNHWNTKINVISRKDIEHLYEHHVLHSLSIAKVINFDKDDRVLDVGTGGGFPGIPLAIAFPETHFTLIDSIEKKINVVKNITKELKLNNVEAVHINAKQIKGKYSYIVSRAVCPLKELVSMTKKNLFKNNGNYVVLKGGDLTDEIKPFADKCKIIPINNFFEETFFETKKIVLLPLTKQSND